MKVLVTGGSRFNGLAIVEELARHGHEVTTFNRGVTPVEFPRGVRQLHGDRHDHEALRATFAHEEFDAIIDTSAYLLPDVESMVDIFRGRIGHYIFISSAVSYAPPTISPISEMSPFNMSEDEKNSYGRNKAICEMYLLKQHREHGFPSSSIKLPTVLGPRNNQKQREALMFYRVLQGRPVVIPGDGSVLSHPSYVFDQAKSIRMMLLNPVTFGQGYNVGMTQYYTDEWFVDTIAAIAGVTPTKVHMPHDFTAEVYRTFPYQIMPRHGVGLVPWYKSSLFDTRKLEDHIGYRQEHTLTAALDETYEWMKRTGLDKSFEWDWQHEDGLLEKLRDMPGVH